VALLTDIGHDQNGKDCLSKLKKEKIDTTLVKKDRAKATSYHYVLWYDTERTILVKHEKYQYRWGKIKKLEKHPPTWIYLSSLGEDSLAFHEEIIEYLKRHPETKLAFQPGTFQIKFGAEKLKEIYARTETFFSNIEEAENILNTEEKDVLKLAKGIASLGPKMVFLSDGEKGAYFYQANELYFLPTYPDPVPVFERTGAGDAFSASIVAGLALGLSPIEAFPWGPINARSVVKYIGSQEGLLTREKLETLLKNAPANYLTTKVP
jgi:ribokinase